MKTDVYDLKGVKKGEVTLPSLFDKPIREDIVGKYLEASRTWQPYSLDPKAGRRHSASGIIRHRRHVWKTGYGKGISRVPRKIIWRRGTQFNWIGAEVSGTRGGRRVHGPKGIRRERKINQKEIKIAISSGLAATGQKSYLARRYTSVKNVSFTLPLVVDSRFTDLKAKQIISLLKTLTGEFFSLALKHRTVRAGKGKTRGRPYKSNAGLLLITSSKEKVRAPGFDIVPINNIAISDLYPLGRLTLYTEKAMEELKQWN